VTGESSQRQLCTTDYGLAAMPYGFRLFSRSCSKV
jgi:hypothetical protein